MKDDETIPTYEVVLPQPPESKWQREHRAFLKLLPALLQTHRDRYVAVHEGVVVGSGEDKVEVAQRAYGQHGYVPIYVGLVTDEPLQPVRLPSRRTLEKGQGA